MSPLSPRGPATFTAFSQISHKGFPIVIGSVFKASALWADALYKLICPYDIVCLCVCRSVCLSVCLSACVFTFEVSFRHLFVPTFQNWMPKILEIRNPWGKVLERNGLRFEKFL